MTLTPSKVTLNTWLSEYCSHELHPPPTIDGVGTSKSGETTTVSGSMLMGLCLTRDPQKLSARVPQPLGPQAVAAAVMIVDSRRSRLEPVLLK